MKVLVCGYEEEEQRVLCRSYMDAPDVDSYLYVYGEKKEVGSFLDVKVVDTEGYDLIGEWCESTE